MFEAGSVVIKELLDLLLLMLFRRLLCFLPLCAYTGIIGSILFGLGSVCV